MILITERLTLRLINFNDLQSLHQLNSIPETDHFNTLGIPENLQQTENLLNEWLIQQSAVPPISYIFCIEITDSKQFIGVIGLKFGKPKYDSAEVWYKLNVNNWGHGYATEALKKLLSFCFDHLHLHRIEAGCDTQNIASIKVLEKVGMLREGLKRKKLPIRGEWKDNFFYAILEEDFYKV